MPEEISFDSYLKGAKQSSRRTRWVVVIIVIASIIAFTVLLNSRPGGWMNQRVTTAQDALKWYPFPDTIRAKLNESGKRAFDQALEWCRGRGFVTGDSTNSQFKDSAVALIMMDLQNLEKIRTENVRLIRVPFFGVTFDVNDAGFVSGFSFLLLLMILRFALNREWHNIRIAFEKITDEKDKGQEKAYYKLLAMEQVLVVPPMDGRSAVWYSRYQPIALIFLPVVIQFIFLLQDLRTFTRGMSVSFFNTIVITLVSSFFLALIIVMAVVCAVIWWRIDKEWKLRALKWGIIESVP